MYHTMITDYQPKIQSWRDHVMRANDISDPVERRLNKAQHKTTKVLAFHSVIPKVLGFRDSIHFNNHPLFLFLSLPHHVWVKTSTH